MVVFNTSGSEVNAKIVYYGPALSGKTTNLEHIYEQMPSDVKGKMVSMKTRTDRTLFFDFLPLQLGDINGYRTRMLLYTVPGQVYYNATRKLVLNGVDAVVFVADSDPAKHEENIDSLRNLEENLNELGLTLDTTPWVIQFNKRDLPDAAAVRTLESELNLLHVPSFEAVAKQGIGVYETFQGIAGMLYNRLTEKLEPRRVETSEKTAPAPVKAAEPAMQTDKSVTDVIEDVLREVPTTAVATEPVAELEPVAMETVETTLPDSPQSAQPMPPTQPTQPTQPAQPPVINRESEDDAFRFASLEAKKMDDNVGEVIDLEENESGDRATPESAENDFITDPCQSTAAVNDTEDIEEIVSSPEDVTLNDRSASMDDECVITVPVLLSRAQIRKTIPIKLRLEVQIIDEDL